MDVKKFRRNSGIALALFLLVAFIGIPRVTVLPPDVEGFVPRGGEPKPCVGFNPASASWGYGTDSCPDGYAFFGVDDPAGVKSPGAVIDVRMNCCPLPSADILLTEISYAPEECPDGSVATGRRRSAQTGSIEMRCAKINSDRYQLGEARSGIYWGEGAAGWWRSTRILWENIPAAIRLAQGREREDKWDVDGCVGYPWGSLLVEKHSKYCSGFSFRQLQFRGLAGDPPGGTPVQMFPDERKGSGTT